MVPILIRMFFPKTVFFKNNYTIQLKLYSYKNLPKALSADLKIDDEITTQET